MTNQNNAFVDGLIHRQKMLWKVRAKLQDFIENHADRFLNNDPKKSDSNGSFDLEELAKWLTIEWKLNKNLIAISNALKTMEAREGVRA
ncbi:MAG: hypothetical protein WC307_03030 [Candidatus Nanoarchaeia archaeon]|jgi:hypothetical protein